MQAHDFAKLMENINAGDYDRAGEIGKAHDCNAQFTMLYSRQIMTREMVEDADGRCTSWIQTFPDGSKAKFSADGKTVEPLTD